MDLTVLILAKNEEENIAEAVASARGISDRVIVLDSGSADRTVELSRKAGAEVHFRAMDDFASQRNFALGLAQTRWVLFLDADERPDEELAQALRSVADRQEAPRQYVLRRRSVAFGKRFRHGVLRPDSVLRLFVREHVRWEGKVHERPVCGDPKETLPGWLDHHTYRTWGQWLAKFDQYTTLWAREAFGRGKRTTPLGALGHASFAFIQMAFLRGGVLDGTMGLVMSANHFFYTLMKYLKLHELGRESNREDP